MVEQVNKLKCRGAKVYEVDKRFALALTPDRTFFITPMAICEIQHMHRNSLTRYAHLRSGIERNQYKTLVDLITDMKLEPGNGVSYRTVQDWELERILV